MKFIKKLLSRRKARRQERPQDRAERKEWRKAMHEERIARVVARHDKFASNPKVQFMSKFSLLFQGLLACLLILIIETCSRHSLISAFSFIVDSPLTFLYNALLIWASLLLVYLFKRRMMMRIIISVFWVLLGVVNGIILAARVTPFNFTDLKLLNDLLAMKSSKYVSTGETILIIVCLVAVLAFIVYIAMRGPKFSGKIHRFRNLVGLVACCALIPFITKGAIHSDILAGYFANLAQGYKDYGFVYSFSASVVDTGMRKPDNYSEEKVKKIAASESDQKTTLKKEDEPNIIFIQLESFIDLDKVNYLKFSEDPTPNFHKLMKNYSSGQLTVPVVGAGTCNTEFEALTGLSIHYFGLGEYPYKTVLKDTNVESSADALKNIGYATHVLHNNGGNFYSRANVFNEMGFNSFTSKEEMNITEYNALQSWPKDNILIPETKKILDSTKNQADYIYTITVESHGSYPDYEVFKNKDKITVKGAKSKEEMYQWEYYANELHEVDKDIGKLIDMLSKRDEKTLVVMYGDHLPTMGLTNEDMTNGSIFETTYATWNNFGMKKQDEDLTSYQLFAEYTNRLGIHEGNIFRYHQTEMAENKTKEKSYLSNLKILQYDILYGKKYLYNQTDPFADNKMTMGTQNVVVNGIAEYTEQEEDEPDKVKVIGKNFTPWSSVYIDGSKVTTQYVSDTCLLISKTHLKDGSKIQVKQLGSSNTVFRVSNPFIVTSAEQFTGKKEKNTSSNYYDELVTNTDDKGASSDNNATEIKTATDTTDNTEK